MVISLRAISIIVLALLLLIGLIIGMIFVIRSMIRHTNRSDPGKNQTQKEMDRMKIYELE